MATNGYRQYNGLPKTTYTSRTRSVLSSNAPKSNSAMSTRTYSRIKGKSPEKSDSDGRELRRTMNFEDNDSSRLNDSVGDLQELENEQELLQRMIDQQRQLQELRERQKRVLELQQQLANMEVTAEISMEEKLSKLNTAKTRLDQLSKLVGTIKSAESTKKRNAGDNSMNESQSLEKNDQVKMALDELNELKMLIGMMSSENELPARKPAATPEPVFPNSIGLVDDDDEEQSDNDYQPVLPEVSVVQYENEENTQYPSRYSSQNKDKRDSVSSQSKSPPRKITSRQNQGNSQRKMVKKVRTKSPEIEDTESSQRLWDEMKRHQILLKELRQRREELEDLMNITKEEENEEEEIITDYNDTNASIRSNPGSPDDSRGVSDAEANDFETSQSGCLFGLNESDTRRLIDLIRNQKTLGAATEKTTATWGSSSSGSSSESEEDCDDNQVIPVDDVKFKKPTLENILGKASGDNRNRVIVSDDVRDAFTQLDYKEEHEIDFRPPTRRRRNITQPLIQSSPIDAGTLKTTVGKIQEDLLSSNATMHLLLEDQQALTKLLMNTLNLQQATVSNNLCYGISPDFLIYQLDNCSSQFAASLKETKDLQWQLYSLTKGGSPVEKPAPVSQGATDNFVPPQLSTLYQSKSGLFIPQTQSHSLAQEVQLSNVPFIAERGDYQQRNDIEKYAIVQKEEKNEIAGNDLFDALRDSIYSEAAILISQNEARPHFLIELFHTLQQLDTDYLRQHALYVLQDVIKGYISTSPKKKDMEPKSKSKSGYGRNSSRSPKKKEYSENTPSESAATSEDELYAKLKARASADTGYDFSLRVSSASELSTPSGDDAENHPFAADDLGSTVIHLDAALRHMREMERMKQEILSASNAAGDGEQVLEVTQISKNKDEIPQVNTTLLRTRIKHIVSEVIPLLKNNHDKTLDKKLVKVLQTKIVDCVGKGMNENRSLTNGLSEGNEYTDSDKLNMERFFSGQLNSILDDSFKKFIGQRVGSCGEDLVIGLSEVLFNELAFFYMMQDLGKEAADNKSQDIPTITINKDVEQDDREAGESESQEEDSNKEDQDNEIDSEISNGEESLPQSEQITTQIEKTSKNPVTVDLSVSETQPLTSYGSGEDEEEEGSGDDYEYREQDVPTSMQQDVTETTHEEGTEENEDKENQLPTTDSLNKDE